MDQVEAHSLPPNPAKVTDSRWQNYMEEYGSDSWELDALTPATINQLIRDAVANYTDPDLWEAAQAREHDETERIRATADKWPEVQRFLDGHKSERRDLTRARVVEAFRKAGGK